MTAKSPFLMLWASARGRLDLAFSEAFVIAPMLQAGNGRPGLDPNRASLTFQAGYLSPSVDQYGMSPGHSENMGQKEVSSHPSLLMSEETLPFRPSSPDVVTRVSTGERFVVSTVEPDGYGRIAVNLTLRTAG